MSRSESELGRLWERLPKSQGFRISIPNPDELYRWVYDTSHSSGDLTAQQREKMDKYKFMQFLTDKTTNIIGHQKTWECSISDDLLDTIGCELSANYSVRSGPWGNIELSLFASPSAIDNQTVWQIPQRISQIKEELYSKGLLARNTIDRDGVHGLVVTDIAQSSTTQISLGFTSPEAMASSPDYKYKPGDYFIPTVQQDLSLSYQKFLPNLQNFQYTASYIVDSIYNVLGMNPPNIKFELSKKKELK